MNDIQVVQQIIKEEGSCNDWALVPVHCAICPFGKMKKADNGSWLGCIEATGTFHMEEEEANKVYKDLAEKMLLEMQIHAALEEQNGA